MAKLTVRDVGLIGRAVRERWNIPDKTRQQAIEVLHECLEDENVKPADRIKAVSTLGALDRLNLQQISMQPKMDIEATIATMSMEEIEEHLKQLENIEENTANNPLSPYILECPKDLLTNSFYDEKVDSEEIGTLLVTDEYDQPSRRQEKLLKHHNPAMYGLS